MRQLRFLVLIFALVFIASASPVELIVDFTSHGEDRTMYVSAEDLGFGLTNNCLGGYCGFYFTTPQPDMPVTIEFNNDFDPHNAFYWQRLDSPFMWHYITGGPYLDNPVTFSPDQKEFTIVVSSNMGYFDTAANPGFYRLSRFEDPDSGGSSAPVLAPDPTPEPATWILLGLGCFVLAFWDRRRQRPKSFR